MLESAQSLPSVCKDPGWALRSARHSASIIVQFVYLCPTTQMFHIHVYIVVCSVRPSASCLNNQLLTETEKANLRERLAGAAGVVSLDPAPLMSSIGRFCRQRICTISAHHTDPWDDGRRKATYLASFWRLKLRVICLWLVLHDAQQERLTTTLQLVRCS